MQHLQYVMVMHCMMEMLLLYKTLYRAHRVKYIYRNVPDRIFNLVPKVC
jgi:hypothetical protein